MDITTNNNGKSENAPASEQSVRNTTSSSSKFQPVTDSQAPIEDPSNSPEVNAKRKQELEAVRKLNSAVQTINLNLEHSKANLQQFKQTVNQTNQLLDMWILILSQTEHTKRLMEDPEWEGGQLDAQKIEHEVQESQRDKNERKHAIDRTSQIPGIASLFLTVLYTSIIAKPFVSRYSNRRRR
ncbi:DASH complex subunit Duo1-domain-containing protein [Umbelopsis sp. AD052]|nr:DASH complex subunit Duo1-domain-containing protein [Umbelopsis sp. AD052]